MFYSSLELETQKNKITWIPGIPCLIDSNFVTDVIVRRGFTGYTL